VYSAVIDRINAAAPPGLMEHAKYVLPARSYWTGRGTSSDRLRSSALKYRAELAVENRDITRTATESCSPWSHGPGLG